MQSGRDKNRDSFLTHVPVSTEPMGEKLAPCCAVSGEGTGRRRKKRTGTRVFNLREAIPCRRHGQPILSGGITKTVYLPVVLAPLCVCMSVRARGAHNATPSFWNFNAFPIFPVGTGAAAVRTRPLECCFSSPICPTVAPEGKIKDTPPHTQLEMLLVSCVFVFFFCRCRCFFTVIFQFELVCAAGIGTLCD